MNIRTPRDLVNTALTCAWEMDDPQLGWALGHLAEISDVSYSQRVQTACIRRSRDRYTIEFSKEFAEKYLATPEDILFVLLHEIFHKVHGDLDRDLPEEGPVSKQVANLAADMQVNSALCDLFFKGGVGLLSRLYGEAKFPELLLLNPERLVSIQPAAGAKKGCKPCKNAPSRAGRPLSQVMWRKRILDHFRVAGFDGEDLETLMSCYFEAWKGETIFEVLYDHLRPFFGEEPPVIRLIGDHSGRVKGGWKIDLPGWDQVFERGGSGGGLFEDDLEISELPAVPYKLVESIRRAMESDLANPQLSDGVAAECSPVFFPGRRESFMLASGIWPLFYKVQTDSRQEEERRAHMYLDVSGSTRSTQPLIYSLALHLKDKLGTPYYLFSNVVEELDMADLARGRVRTTGGTDFDCVFEHASRCGFRKVILLTDGFACISPENVAKVKSGQIALFLMLTDSNFVEGSPLVQLAREKWVLSDFGLKL